MGAYATTEEADKAIEELEHSGYTPDELSVVSKTGRYSQKYSNNNVGLGAVVGATTGGTVGGLAGFLTGLGVVPVLAGLFIAGPITTALGVAGVTVTGVVAGAAMGGLLGALMGLGLPRRVAQSYQNTIEEGGVLIGLNEQDGMAAEGAQQILSTTGAQDIAVLAVPIGEKLKEEVIEDPREYLMKHHLPVFGETLADDYYEDDTL
jgi:uncharacterized membrane protein